MTTQTSVKMCMKMVFGTTWISPKIFISGWKTFLKEGETALLKYFLLTSLFCQYFDLGICGTFWISLLLLFFRRIFAGGFCNSTKRLDGQVVVVTGSNTGIGKETAKDLSARGATVVLACRDIVKAGKAALEIRAATDGDVEVLKLDLASFVSIRNFAEKLKKKYPKVHILINNAGIMTCPNWKTEDGFEMQMGTNHFGHFLLTQLVLPLMKHGDPARIITVSSHGHYGGKIPFDDWDYVKQGYDPFVAYSNSKAANVLFTRQLSKELEGTQIQVFALHPGCVATELMRHIPFGSYMMLTIDFFVKTPLEGAQTTIHCATDAIQHKNLYFSDCVPMTPSDLVMDDGVAKKLWEVTESMINKTSQ
ncbi:retinol dehydrogenase 12-like isoform X2 [Oratosquilla oratoria]|uniref:retinol dehydrogenase 12-like isoform X2 n=1 Tax=Oratosquilla oratoria TaxID=337810 RepID=UPI003F774977